MAHSPTLQELFDRKMRIARDPRKKRARGALTVLRSKPAGGRKEGHVGQRGGHPARCPHIKVRPAQKLMNLIDYIHRTAGARSEELETAASNIVEFREIAAQRAVEIAALELPENRRAPGYTIDLDLPYDGGATYRADVARQTAALFEARGYETTWAIHSHNERGEFHPHLHLVVLPKSDGTRPIEGGAEMAEFRESFSSIVNETFARTHGTRLPIEFAGGTLADIGIARAPKPEIPTGLYRARERARDAEAAGQPVPVRYAALAAAADRIEARAAAAPAETQAAGLVLSAREPDQAVGETSKTFGVSPTFALSAREPVIEAAADRIETTVAAPAETQAAPGLDTASDAAALVRSLGETQKAFGASPTAWSGLVLSAREPDPGLRPQELPVPQTQFERAVAELADQAPVSVPDALAAKAAAEQALATGRDGALYLDVKPRDQEAAILAGAAINPANGAVYVPTDADPQLARALVDRFGRWDEAQARREQDGRMLHVTVEAAQLAAQAGAEYDAVSRKFYAPADLDPARLSNLLRVYGSGDAEATADQAAQTAARDELDRQAALGGQEAAPGGDQDKAPQEAPQRPPEGHSITEALLSVRKASQAPVEPLQEAVEAPGAPQPPQAAPGPLEPLQEAPRAPAPPTAAPQTPPQASQAPAPPQATPPAASVAASMRLSAALLAVPDPKIAGDTPAAAVRRRLQDASNADVQKAYSIAKMTSGRMAGVAAERVSAVIQTATILAQERGMTLEEPQVTAPKPMVTKGKGKGRGE